MSNPPFSFWIHRHRYLLLIAPFTGSIICFIWLYVSQYTAGFKTSPNELIAVYDSTAEKLVRHAARPLKAEGPRKSGWDNSSLTKTVVHEVFSNGGQPIRTPRVGKFRRRVESRMIEISAFNKLELVTNLPPTIGVGTDFTSAAVASKRQFIRQMMKHAWYGYARYAWGYGRVAPNTKQPASIDTFGHNTKLGVTVVDSLDSLWIMGLRDEYEHARQWTVQNLDFANVDCHISVFETNIRILGGLLSAFALSADVVLLQKANELGRLLLPAFDTPTGIPWALYNFKSLPKLKPLPQNAKQKKR